jgi:translation initiation factor IF-2
MEVPEIEAPKVINKIDLSTIDSSTRPKKGVKKSKAEKTVEPEKVEEPVEQAEEAEIVSVDTEAESDLPPTIENIKADKLEGPKVVGKIQLPADSETRPKANEEKRKRKRIPIEKKTIRRKNTTTRRCSQRRASSASRGIQKRSAAASSTKNNYKARRPQTGSAQASG